MERLIIFGGTFDPIHNGHLRIARKASLLLNADVVFVPAKSPRWKNPTASEKDRLKMLRLALQENGSPSFFISKYELEKDEEVNYSFDTVSYFKKKFPKKELFLLIGADEVNKFPEWHKAKELSKMARIIFANRLENPPKQEIISEYKMVSLNFFESGDVSSSSIRELKSIDTPTKVLNYIIDNNLYFMKKLHSFLGDKRLSHSLSVANVAYSIAKANNIENPQRAYIAGALHDIGKELPKEKAIGIMDKFYSEYKDYPSFAYHQFTGSYLAKTEFNIEDETILDAIKYHCTGKAHMSQLAKIIYAADKIEPTRGYDSSSLIKDCLNDYYVGFLHVIKENAKFLSEKGESTSVPLTKECFDEYLNKESK